MTRQRKTSDDFDSDEPDIVAVVADRFVDALRAAHLAVERMSNESRVNPTPQEGLCFRSAGWDQLTRPGQTKWQRQLGVESNRAELRDILGSAVERKEELDSLARVTKAFDDQSPALLAEIEKLQKQLNALQRDVDDAQGAVTHRARILVRAADPRVLPEFVEAAFVQSRASAKRDAAFAPWWSMQGRADHIASILTRDPNNYEDCNLLKPHILRECPDGLRADKTNAIADTFDHSRVAVWFGELRRELAEKLPAIEKGKAELAAKLEEIDRAEKSWFIDDHDRRLAEAK